MSSALRVRAVVLPLTARLPSAMPCRLAGAHQPIAMPPDPSECLPRQLLLFVHRMMMIYNVKTLMKKMWEITPL